MVDIKFVKLIYSYNHNDLSAVEIRPEGYMPAGYYLIVGQIDEKDALAFIRRIRRKYIKGRKSGRFPSQEIVIIELELFMKLKDYHRKLV